MKTLINSVEVSKQLFLIVEDKRVFDMVENNRMYFETLRDTDDGVFPEVEDYISLINDMDENGISAFLRWISNGKPTFNNGYCKITRSGYGDVALLEFEKPISVAIAIIGDCYIIEQVDRIEGVFSYEWFWNKSNKRQKEHANGFEIYFTPVNMRLSRPVIEKELPYGECLDKMLEIDRKLYEQIMDTTGFAYYFNNLCLLARKAQDGTKKS